MVKSLAWRIQLWHGVTLLAVVGGLGAFLYHRIETARYEQIDSELEGAAQVLLSVVKAMPGPQVEDPDFRPGRRPPPEGRPPPDGRGPGGRRPPPDRRGPPVGDRDFEVWLDDMLREGPGDDRPPRPDPERFEKMLALPASFADRYANDPPYFVVWRPQGDVMKASSDEPPVAFTDVPSSLAAQMRDDPDAYAEAAPVFRRSGARREIFLSGPRGSAVVVGRSIEQELAELAQWRWMLVLSGTGAVVIGALGGAWLVRSALRPLRQMSALAAEISSTNLSARIETRHIDVELAALAQTLNAAFDRLEADFVKQARFTADASHELRTPLTVILGHLELALAQPQADEATRAALLASQRAARRMKSLVEQLLLLARADGGKLEPQRQVFDFGAAVEECVDLLGPLAREKELTIEKRIAPLELSGDPNLLAQVAINLITNAIVHNRQRGSVTVTLSFDQRHALLIVADTGPGIPAEHQARLFERFYRADAARTRTGGGAGLGLAIAQSIVVAHGGDLHMQSRAGEGTEFIVRLPLGATTAATLPPLADRALSPAS